MNLYMNFKEFKKVAQILKSEGEVINQENIELALAWQKTCTASNGKQVSVVQVANSHVKDEDIIFTDVDEINASKQSSLKQKNVPIFGYSTDSRKDGLRRFGIKVELRPGDPTKYTPKECQNENWVLDIKSLFENSKNLWENNSTICPIGEATVHYYSNPTNSNPNHLSIAKVYNVKLSTLKKK